MPPRVAFFPDSFHEVNGVAHTARNFEAFGRRRGMPFDVRQGHGLSVVSQLASGWAVERLPAGKVVWADLPAEALGHARFSAARFSQ